MTAKRQKLVKIFQETRQFLSRPNNHFTCSSWADAPAALREIDGIIGRIERPKWFAPSARYAYDLWTSTNGFTTFGVLRDKKDGRIYVYGQRL